MFEGEGTFNIINNIKPKAISITSTDKDVLEKIVKYFGGVIYQQKRRKDKNHWKTAYIWKLNVNDSIKLINEMKPFLGKRRNKRGEEFINLRKKQINERILKQNIVNNKRNKMFELRKLGYTHKKIAEIIGCERSYVSHVLKGKKFKINNTVL